MDDVEHLKRRVNQLSKDKTYVKINAFSEFSSCCRFFFPFFFRASKSLVMLPSQLFIFLASSTVAPFFYNELGFSVIVSRVKVGLESNISVLVTILFWLPSSGGWEMVFVTVMNWHESWGITFGLELALTLWLRAILQI